MSPEQPVLVFNVQVFTKVCITEENTNLLSLEQPKIFNFKVQANTIEQAHEFVKDLLEKQIPNKG